MDFSQGWQADVLLMATVAIGAIGAFKAFQKLHRKLGRGTVMGVAALAVSWLIVIGAAAFLMFAATQLPEHFSVAPEPATPAVEQPKP